MKAKIVEVFESVQGEGKFAGTLQVFVRFFGCNARCHWCDTKEALGESSSDFKEFDCDELVREVVKASKNTNVVSLTGGEPLLQTEFLRDFAFRLKQEGFSLHLETNGILSHELEDVINFIDVVSMDLKLPSSTKQLARWGEHESFLRTAVQKDIFVKVVVTSDTIEDDIVRAVELVARIDSTLLFILQPDSFDAGKGALNKCLDFQKVCLNQLSNVRVLPQIQKILDIR